MTSGYCCDMRGMLSFLILFLLSRKPMHGQALAREIGRRRGGRPSPGTIYPALKALKGNGLIRERKGGRQRAYELTPAGKRGLTEAKKAFCRAFMDVL